MNFEEGNKFLVHWFAGWAEGLAELDEQSRWKMLEACGHACARSYTVQVFRAAKEASTDGASFLTELAVRFPEANYEQVAPCAIRVAYRRCACDLVELGLVTSPLLCDCSAANLRANFEAALGVASLITPSRRGIGPMTITMLLRNTLHAYRARTHA